jgi:recombination protein RecR
VLEPIDNLVKVLSRLPGLGRRSAQRAAMALVRDPARILDPLSSALADVRRRVRCCSRCGGFTTEDRDPCDLCSNPLRENVLCVVEDASDIVTIEASGAFKGRYHSLGGKLSPVHHVGPEKLRVPELKERIAAESISEVVLAVSTDMEGDATAGYVEESLRGFPSEDAPVKVTRLAFGLPADSGIAYSDPLTLRRAIAARR